MSRLLDFSRAEMHQNNIFFWSFAPDLTGRAYSSPSTNPLAGGEGVCWGMLPLPTNPVPCPLSALLAVDFIFRASFYTVAWLDPQSLTEMTLLADITRHLVHGLAEFIVV